MASSVGPSALWYLTRGTGAVALAFLALHILTLVLDTIAPLEEHLGGDDRSAGPRG